MHSLDKISIKIGARSSPLSRAQVEEVQKLLLDKGLDVHFDPIWVEVIGDKDQLTSLKNLEKTDFFTKEIDELLLSNKCRAAVHSAKDLPDPMPKGLCIAALTKGVDSADVLVMKGESSLSTLPPKARIATSSQRREEMMRSLRKDFVSVDIRGTIQDRLQKLDSGYCDALIMAEAALIRLGLTHLNRIRLEGPVAKDQGRLAVIIQEEDVEMRNLFACIDSR